MHTWGQVRRCALIYLVIERTEFAHVLNASFLKLFVYG